MTIWTKRNCVFDRVIPIVSEPHDMVYLQIWRPIRPIKWGFRTAAFASSIGAPQNFCNNVRVADEGNHHCLSLLGLDLKRCGSDAPFILRKRIRIPNVFAKAFLNII